MFTQLNLKKHLSWWCLNMLLYKITNYSKVSLYWIIDKCAGFVKLLPRDKEGWVHATQYPLIYQSTALAFLFNHMVPNWLSDSRWPREPGQVCGHPDSHAPELPAGPGGGRLKPEAAGRQNHRRALLRQGCQKSAVSDIQAGETPKRFISTKIPWFFIKGV